MPWLEADEHTIAFEAARDIALRRLERSLACRSQVQQALERKQVDPDIAQQVLDRLEEVGLLDDLAYAQTLARTRFREKFAARRAIASELKTKGISAANIAAALEQIDDADEAQAALALARKKAATLTNVEPAVATRRLAGALQRKGYGPADTWHAIEVVMGEQLTN